MEEKNHFNLIKEIIFQVNSHFWTPLRLPRILIFNEELTTLYLDKIVETNEIFRNKKFKLNGASVVEWLAHPVQSL